MQLILINQTVPWIDPGNHLLKASSWEKALFALALRPQSINRFDIQARQPEHSRTFQTDSGSWEVPHENMAQVQCTDGLDASSLLQEMRQQEQLSLPLPLPVNQRIYSGTPVTTAIPAAAAVLVNQNILVHYTVLVLECRPPASILTLTDSDERSQGIWVASLLASRSSSPCPLRTLCVCVCPTAHVWAWSVHLLEMLVRVTWVILQRAILPKWRRPTFAEPNLTWLSYPIPWGYRCEIAHIRIPES